ncbi:MAG: DUF3108 domain-containing protein [candidate division KSB1 bacterium]|nr:DUF3108 domain-containing protein [candidate division KSB1 bacterium]
MLQNFYQLLQSIGVVEYWRIENNIDPSLHHSNTPVAQRVKFRILDSKIIPPLLMAVVILILLTIAQQASGQDTTDKDISKLELPDTSQAISELKFRQVPADTGMVDSSKETIESASLATYRRYIENGAFRVGEKLQFVIRYGPIVAGNAIMSIPEITTVGDAQCYHLVSEARSNDFFSTFFKVQDKVESFMDVQGLFSWRFEKHLREGRFKADKYVVYDQINRLAMTPKDTMQVPPFVQDILSSFYFVRTQKLEVGKPLYIDNHSDGKIYPLEVKIHRKEKVKVRAGTFDCLVVEPVLRGEGLFQQKGRLTIWLTDDHKKMPVLMKSKVVIIGSIVAELEEYEGIVKP